MKQNLKPTFANIGYSRNFSLDSLWACAAALVCVSVSPVYSQDGDSAAVGVSDSLGASLTIYNQNFGLIKDTREVQLRKGLNFLRFEDVAAAIDPTTVSFTSLSAPNSVVVREQNYQYDIMDPTTILEKSVGKEIKIRKFQGNNINEIVGTLLNPPAVTITSTSGHSTKRPVGMIIKTASGIIMNPKGEVEIDSLPPGLVSKPSLLWKLQSDKDGLHKTEISYQTRGMNWRSDYVAIVNSDDTKLDMTSWVTIDNKSGAGFKNASLKLLAGDVHRVQVPEVRTQMLGNERLYKSRAPQQFQEQSFSEYHLYSLSGHTDINNNETKQLSLFNANAVPTKKLFIYEPVKSHYSGRQYNDAKKVNVKLEIANTSANNLGMALPKGKVRVYKKDSDGALQFIGEDQIDHTPRDEKIRLYIGNAFDLVGERKQTNHARPNPRTQRLSYSISLRNHKEEKVTITAVEHAYGQWKVLSSSHKYHKRDAKTFEFTTDVPAGSEVTIDYEIEIRV